MSYRFLPLPLVDVDQAPWTSFRQGILVDTVLGLGESKIGKALSIISRVKLGTELETQHSGAVVDRAL